MNEPLQQTHRESVFTGNMFGWLGINLATYVISFITFGLAFPWLFCWNQTWYTEHTYINGRQLHFNGTGMQFFGNWIKWLLLTLITLGIYWLWIPVNIEKWATKHTSFADEILFIPEDDVNASLGEILRDVGNTILKTLQALVGTVIEVLQLLWQKVYTFFTKHKSNTSWICSCGHHNSHDGSFCSACGQAKQKNSPYCPRCGAALLENAKFCGKCGYPISK